MARGFKDQATPALRRIQRDIEDVPQEAFEYFRSITPLRTGRARRRTRLVAGRTIVPDYAYAEALDSGSSRQAPQGMSEPTIRYIQRLVESTVSRNG